MVSRAIALLLATLCMVAAAGLPATEASAATVTPISYGGHDAGAVFESVDGCMQRSAFVFAGDDVRREGHAGRIQRPQALVSFAQTNTCTGAGSFVYGRADLAPGDLTVRGDLGAASLHATVLVQQPFQGAPAVRVTLDLEWRAAGDALRRTWTGISRSDDIDVGHELWGYRPAVASGSISDGVIDYAAAAPSVSAALMSSKVGDIEISR